MTVFLANYNVLGYELRAAYLIGILIAGNIVDNIDSPKRFLILTQLGLATFWLCSGLFLSFDEAENC